ncbi:MAG: hypothetical protein ACREFX_11410 [Opitutaceae bacterium]
MKRFRFSLRAVAVVRAHREMRARQALAASLAAQAEIDRAAAAARARAAALEEVISGGRRAEFSAALQVSYLQAYRGARVAEADADRKCAAAAAETARCRAECIEADRQLKRVSRLEERARSVHRLAVLREEQAQIDEQAVFRSVTRSGVGP